MPRLLLMEGVTYSNDDSHCFPAYNNERFFLHAPVSRKTTGEIFFPLYSKEFIENPLLSIHQRLAFLSYFIHANYCLQVSFAQRRYSFVDFTREKAKCGCLYLRTSKYPFNLMSTSFFPQLSSNWSQMSQCLK